MAEAKKIVLKVQLNCEKCKRRVLKTAADVEGVDSVSVDKDSKLTVIGNPDPVSIAQSLRKYGDADILSVGPKDPPKKEDAEKKKETKTQTSTRERDVVVLVPEYHCFSDENPNACAIC